MVVINCKRLPREENSKDYDEFLMSFVNTTNVGEVTDAVQKMQNDRVRLKWMIAAAKQLAKDSCTDDNRHLLNGPVEEAERYLLISRTTEQKLDSKPEEIKALIETLKGSVIMVFAKECSGIDAQKKLAEVIDAETVSDVDRSKAHRILSIIDDGAVTEDILQGNATLWWSGKPLARDAELSKYTGRNDKTKIIVKLTIEGSSAPAREPAIDMKTQHEMMAFWHRKQEEQKKLVEDEDISFGNSEWANPSGLRNQLRGMDNIQFKPR